MITVPAGKKGSLGLVILILLWAAFAHAADVPQVKPDELKAMIESKKADFVVVDVQPKGAYALGHIKGAINLPWSSDITSAGSLPRNKMLILYCDCAHEEDSTDAAQQLTIKFGFTKVRTLEGGWSGWQKLGYPIDKSKGK
jgi:rhodanese-related sulfurtransferase